MTARKKAFDGRTVEARRVRKLTRQLEKPYRDAGLEIGLAERNTIDVAVMLRMQMEAVQAAQCRGEPVETDHIVRMAGVALRVHNETLRQAKARQSNTNTLQNYLKERTTHVND